MNIEFLMRADLAAELKEVTRIGSRGRNVIVIVTSALLVFLGIVLSVYSFFLRYFGLDIMGIFLAAVGLLYVPCYYFGIHLRVSQVAATLAKLNGADVKYVFDDVKFVKESTSPAAYSYEAFYYPTFYRIIETREWFFLFISAAQGYAVPKAAMPPDAPAQLSNLLRANHAPIYKRLNCR